jgi:hypothetical protein
LLLIDELPHYLLEGDGEKIGNITLPDLTIAFIMNLVSSVASSKKHPVNNDPHCQATTV